MEFIKKLFLIALAFAIIFGVFEIGLRLSGYSGEVFQRDVKTGLMTIIPNWQGTWKKECFANQVKMNSLGFHDTEHKKEKSDRVVRIAIVGDSFVEALQVPLAKTFYKILEDKLNEEYKNTGKKFEVLAFGHSGNGTFLNALYLQKYALAYQPDLAINAFLAWNDFKDDNYELSKSGGLSVPKFFPEFKENGELDLAKAEAYLQSKTESGAKVRLKRLASRSAFVMWIYPKYYRAKSRLRGAGNQSSVAPRSVDVTAAPLDWQQYLANYPENWTKVWAQEEALLKAGKKIAEEGGAKFLLMSWAENYRVYPSLLAGEDFLDKFAFDFDKPERYLGEIAARQNFPYLPLLPVFKAKAASSSQEMEIAFPCDGHYNEIGHAWAAEALFEYLNTHPELLGMEKTV